jgi:hypothetical protein
MPLDIDRVRAEYPALREGFATSTAAAGTLVAALQLRRHHRGDPRAVANKTTAFAAGRRALEIVAQARGRSPTSSAEWPTVWCSARARPR